MLFVSKVGINDMSAGLLLLLLSLLLLIPTFPDEFSDVALNAEAVAVIGGSDEVYLQVGSALHLQCTIRRYTEPPTFVFWYHNERMINFDARPQVNSQIMIILLKKIVLLFA